ncbi:hypothetical protein K7432_002987 [Basidiobolus ranarum]|uniref:Uncharacterized protein n=1 Tax=Basidiobolus ranarum TaxID=34480 RepID=A0ABR2W6Z7_9FUNG
MFSIKNITNSDTYQTSEHTISFNYVDAKALPSRATAAQYLRVIKTRLSFARYKIENGWEDKSFEEIVELRKSKTISISYNDLPEDGDFLHTTVGTKRKRSHVEDPTPSISFTKEESFTLEENVEKANFSMNRYTTDSINNKYLNRGALTLPSFNSLRYGGDIQKEGSHLLSNRPKRLNLIPSQHTVMEHSNFLTKPSPFDGLNFPWPTPQRTSNSANLENECSASPGYETAEATMLLSSPLSSTPTTPQYSPSERSFLHNASKLQPPSQDVFISPSSNEACNLISFSRHHFNK